eukprot:2810044-Amphidinium_carterae.1
MRRTSQARLDDQVVTCCHGILMPCSPTRAQGHSIAWLSFKCCLERELFTPGAETRRQRGGSIIDSTSGDAAF